MFRVPERMTVPVPLLTVPAYARMYATRSHGRAVNSSPCLTCFYPPYTLLGYNHRAVERPRWS